MIQKLAKNQSWQTNYVEKNLMLNCSYETYRHTVTKDLNIAFTKLDHEKCEKCEIFYLHNKDQNENNLSRDCLECVNWQDHKRNAEIMRKNYTKDKEKKCDQNNIYYSTDMQKIIMLPRLPMFKQVLFCPRIIAYDESFVPLGKLKQYFGKPFAALWHEGISGRNKEDIISAFYAFFLKNKD